MFPPPQIGFLENQILRLYNQFPRDYNMIAEMTAQLDEIARMGFNAVWINPIQETGHQQHTVDWLQEQHSDSLYAMSNQQDGAFCIKGNTTDLQTYTQIAKNNRLTPLFDLVLNHVAADSPLCHAYPEWFQYDVSRSFRDCRAFNYNSAHRAAIMNFWQEYINRYIRDYGFMGARVDAVKHIPADVQIEIYDYIQQACIDTHNVRPVIFAELLLSQEEARSKLLQRLCDQYIRSGITHTFISHMTGNAYWDVFPVWGNIKRNYLLDMQEQSKIGWVVGFCGNHDKRTLFGKIIDEKAKQLDADRYTNYVSAMQNFLGNARNHNPELELLMKKKIALVAFMSNGGWYLLGGDEFGDPGMYDGFIHDSRKCTKLVFNSHNTAASFMHRAEHVYHLRDFITNVNAALNLLPQPRIKDWMEYVDLSDMHNLVVIIRHNGEACSAATSQLLLINVSDNLIQLDDAIKYAINSHRTHINRQNCPLDSIQQTLVLGNIEAACYLNNPAFLNHTEFAAPVGTPPIMGPT